MRNGQHIAESQSICEYLDAEFGPTPLVGQTATELAETSMWCRRVEQKVCLRMADAFQNGERSGKRAGRDGWPGGGCVCCWSIISRKWSSSLKSRATWN